MSTSNYLARDSGIKAGIPCSRARKLNPEAVFLLVNMDLYRAGVRVSNLAGPTGQRSLGDF